MARFLVDEDLPRSLVQALSSMGHEAHDLRDLGLRGRPDREVFEYAVSHGLCLITGDLGFGNLLDFPLGSHSGIVVARFPNELKTSSSNAALVSALAGLTEEDLTGSLIIVEPDRFRIRRPL